MGISQNKIVKINYKGTLSDGTVFDTSEGKEPLEFIFGIGMIIPGLEKGIEGLKEGDKKTVEIKAEEAYGPVMEEAVQEVPKEQLPADIKLEVGMQLAAQGPQGAIPVKIVEILEKTIKVDFNHPLAGKDLKFDVEVVEVKEATEEDKKRILGPMVAPQDGCAGCSGSCENGECNPKEESLEEALEEKAEEKEKKKE